MQMVGALPCEGVAASNSDLCLGPRRPEGRRGWATKADCPSGEHGRIVGINASLFGKGDLAYLPRINRLPICMRAGDGTIRGWRPLRIMSCGLSGTWRVAIPQSKLADEGRWGSIGVSGGGRHDSTNRCPRRSLSAFSPTAKTEGNDASPMRSRIR
jgi:hypothetical protein